MDPDDRRQDGRGTVRYVRKAISKPGWVTRGGGLNTENKAPIARPGSSKKWGGAIVHARNLEEKQKKGGERLPLEGT